MSHLIPSGAQTYSKAPSAYPANAPRRIVAADGAWVTCEDGRQYIDCVSALGAVMLGHNDPAVNHAAFRQMHRVVSASLPTYPESELAERLVKLIPGAEMVRYGKNGNDVVNAAVRIARAHTGRDIVLRNGYHGHADWCIEYPRAGGVLRANIEARWHLGEVEFGAALLERTAAIVLDPRPAHDPVELPAAMWRDLRQMCDEHGTALILDEMVTGFRGGHPGYPVGVVPDLWCGAKALGNGWPITVLAGRADLMCRLERDVFYSTTFAGEAVSIAAANACLEEMERTHATATVQALGKLIREAYEQQAASYGVDTWVESYDARPVLRFRDPEDQRIFGEACIAAGLLLHAAPYVNVMVAHEECLRELVGALGEGLRAVAERKVVKEAA